MKDRKFVINNKLGLHARPSAQLVTVATRYASEVFYTKADMRVNGKSIMGVMMLAAEKGAELIVEVDGPDETAAIEAIIEVIQSGFDENN